MKKIKYALSLALLAAAPAIFAQNIDTKAPAEPGFMVTLNVTDKGSAADTVWIRDYKNTKDSVMLKDNQVKYGSYLRIGLKAQPGQTIDSLMVGEKKANWTGTADDKTIKGDLTFTAGKPNLYSLPLGPIASETNVTVVWKEKTSWNLTFGNTTQTVNSSSGATAVTVKDNGTDNAEIIKGYYKTDACGDSVKLGDIKSAGTYYVKLQAAETADKKGLDMVIPLFINNKLTLTISAQPSVAADLKVKEGQALYGVPLTAGTCKYGDRVIKGTWAWENPNLVLVKGSNSCKAVFTPDSSAIYNNITSSNITVSALYVATVTVEQSAGGTVVIRNATPDNKYVGTTSAYDTITAVATPTTGYKFLSWVSPTEVTAANSSSGTEKYEEAKTKTIIGATDGTVIKAAFAKATRKVTFTASSDNGTVKVLNGDKAIATNDEIPYGTNLTIVTEPAEGKQVKSVSYTYKETDQGVGTETKANNFVVGGVEGSSYTVNVEFEEIPARKVMVTVTPPVNGAITLLDADNNAVNPNSAVEQGSSLTIVAVPNRGYRVAGLIAGGEEVKTDFITVNTAINISATFEKEKYNVTKQDIAQVEFSNVTFGESEFNTPIKNVKASIKDGYKGTHKLVSLLLNNQAIENGKNDLVVEGDMNFSALVKTLEPVNIRNEKETKVVYNGNAQVYTVKTAANLAGFEVTFKKDGNEVVAPSTVGKYQVVITRAADELYAAYSNEKDYTLEILPGVPGVLDIPFSDKLAEDGVAAKTTVAGEWLDQAGFQSKYPNREPATKAGSSSVIYFVPSDDNLGYVKTTTVPSTNNGAKTVTITYADNAGDHGTVSVENGSVPVGKTYAGLNLTLNAKVEPGYKIDWSKITLTAGGGTLNNDQHTFTVSDNVTVNVAAEAFTKMSAPSYSTNKSPKATYTGRSQACSVAGLGLNTDVAWKIQYVKQKEDGADAYTTSDPVDAGTYKIKVSCDNGETYSALAEVEIGTLTIEKQKLVVANIQVPNASPVAKNAMLSTSILDTNGKVTDGQGNPVPGQFTWESDIKVTNAGDQNIIFTPSDQNNYSVDGLQLKSYVSLKGVLSYQMVVKAENGNSSNLVFTDATGKVVDPAKDKVPAGMKLYITANSGTITNVSVVGTNATAGSETLSGEPTKWYCIAGSSAFTVTVSFKSDGGGTDTPSEGVAVTGITLNKSTLTLAPQKSEKLVATVAPTGATKKDVKWTSTDPAIASVDADGTVKALKTGKATIIATTVDGGFTAMCEVTVDAATGIEKILSESRVYGQRGQIIIEPAAPVEATIVNLAGAVIYKNLVNGTEQVPAYSGIYVVRLSASGKATTTKVIVR